VRPGSALAAAWALAPRLRVLPRDPAAETGALEAVAAWACQFTSKVSLEPPQGVLLEVEGSLRLFGGAGRLMARLRSGLAGIGFEALLAAGPTARAALWLARGESETLEALPVCAIAPSPEALALLQRIGVGTLGELMRLPRAGVAPRFGQGLLDELDRALGKIPEARAFFVPPERFSAQLELPAPVAQAESVLFAARRLLRERLGALALASPAEALRLEAGELAPLAGATPGLFRDAHSEAEDWERLLERLQARLGGALVHGLALHADHRPERAWRAVGDGDAAAAAGPRPLWLLEPPRRLGEGDFALLAGPERIEAGWWDGEDVVRDYFIARTRAASLAWIYRAPGGWFLHGLFA